VVSEVVVVVPTYNEKENIEALVGQLLDLEIGLEVVIVDDNSPDGTGRLADELCAEAAGRVSVVHRSGKLGLGTAYVSGFRSEAAGRAEYVCTMDADFSHHPRYIPELVNKARLGHDLVIGSRYVRGGGASGTTLDRKMLSWGANAFARAMLSLQAHDATAGFRCYRRAVLDQVDLDGIRASGYSFLIEMLYRVQRGGWAVTEVPILFENRRLGASKISRDEISKALMTVLRLAIHRARGGQC
jgi:dolichol-phosphate mannosyltransferase